MPLPSDYARQSCRLARALEVVGERWTLLIVRDAFYGVRRFNDFQAHLDIPRAVLAGRLRALVEDGIMERLLHTEGPARVEYVLTRKGRALWPALYALVQWGAEFAGEDAPGRQYFHVDCDRVNAEGLCPRCGRRVPPEELEMRPGGADEPRTDPVSVALKRPHRLLQPLFTTAPSDPGAAATRGGASSPWEGGL